MAIWIGTMMNRWSCGIWGRPHVQTSYWGIPDCTFIEPPVVHFILSLDVFRPFVVRNIPQGKLTVATRSIMGVMGLSKNIQQPWQGPKEHRDANHQKQGELTKKKWFHGGFMEILWDWTNRTCQWGIQWAHRQTCQLRRIKCWLLRWMLSHK